MMQRSDVGAVMASEGSGHRAGLVIEALGPLTVRVDGRVQDVGGPKPRLLLALLVAGHDRALSSNWLIDRLWPEEPPPSARKSLQVHVSHLRRALGPAGPLLTTPGGYMLRTDGVEVDLVAFERELQAGTAVLRTDPARSRAILVEALARWKGMAFGELGDEPALLAEIARANESRLLAVELRLEADLRLGRHAELVGELEALVAEHPLRERLRGLQMLALYRSGRQADALRAYARVRELLREELGLDPSPELQELERQVLSQAPELSPSAFVDGDRQAFLATDIEDSTSMWDAEPDAMTAALARHDAILAESVASAGGRIFKRTGDGILAVFPTIAAAVAAAVDGQGRLADEPWSTLRPLRVRMAADQGPAHERDGDFFGPVLNRLMRVMSSGHGGQVLVTDEIVPACGAATRSLGFADYKGVGRLHVHQIVEVGLEHEHPGLRTERTAPALTRPAFAQAVRGYEVREELGRGDFGVVYRAYQASVGREVAVKAIRPDLSNHPGFVKRFEAEAQFVAQLEHPHIVSLYDYWRDPEGAYLVMRLFRGGSLAQALQRGPWNPASAMRLLDQVGSGLAFAHRHGVLHRDIKPANVLLDDDGNAYLGDFGIAAHHIDAVGGPIASSVAYLAPEELSGAPADQRSDIYCFGVLAFELLTGTRPELGEEPPSLRTIRHDVPAEVEAVIGRATSARPGDRFERVEDMVRALRQAFGVDVSSDAGAATTPDGEVRNPYKGLRAFAEVDAKDFYGRDALVDALVESVRARTVTAVIGPSGSGKSSAVKAGLVPAVRTGALGASGGWIISEMFPGSFPFEELEACLLRAAVGRPPRLLDELQDDPNGLLRVSKQILPDDDTSLLVVIDQFEEIFSLTRDESVRKQFLDNLVTVAHDERSRVRVVLTMRADFFDRALSYPDFGAIVSAGMVPVTPPSDDNLRVVVSRPARSVGLDLENGLVDAIVRDISGEPGGMPLLQYALMELVDGRQGRQLTLEAYRAAGGAHGALARRAEQIYSDLAPRARDAAREMFLRLVSVADDGDDTRRRVRRSELTDLITDTIALNAAIEDYGAFRLLSFDHDPVTRGPTIEVAHEALIKQWPRYQGWIDEHREDLLLERRLELAARDWHNSGRDPSFLLGGARLDQYRTWTESTDLHLTELEQAHLTASEEHARRSQQAANEQRGREVLLRRRSRLLVASAVVGASLLVVATVAVVSRRQATDATTRAERQQAVAETQRRLADTLATELASTQRAQQLAISSLAQLATDSDLAMLLAIEAVRTADSLGTVEPGALDALHWALQEGKVVFPASASTPIAVRPGPLGFTGVFMLPVPDLVDVAQRNVDRSFTPDECERFFEGSPCPDPQRPLVGPLQIAGGDDEYRRYTDQNNPLKGTTVTIRGAFDNGIGETLRSAVAASTPGVEVTYVPDSESVFASGARGEYDIAMSPQPGAMRALAASGRLLDLSAIVSGPDMERRFGPDIAALSRVPGAPSGDAVYAVPVNLDNKSNVLYNRAVFATHGYEAPQTWADLVALSDRMVAAGVTPWCWATTTPGIAPKGGFPVTDWIENILLRQAGPTAYDDWVQGKLRFDSAPVRAAFERLGQLVFPSGYTKGGAATSAETAFFLAIRGLASDEALCAMYLIPSFALDYLPHATAVDVGFFPLPPIDPRFGDPIVGGGNQVSLVVDTPENRAVLTGMMTTSFYDRWINLDPAYIPPDLYFDTATVSDPDHAELIRSTQQRIRAGTYRFDAADQMPPEVGGEAFYAEPMAWFHDGPAALDRVLEAIDRAWPGRA